MIKAVIFDMDGVLIDTEKYLFRYWKQAAAEAGYELTDQILLGMRSLASEFAVPYFKEYVGEHADYAAIRSRRKELMSQHIAANGVEKNQKVDELLDYLHAHGYKTAAANSN